MKSSNGIKMIPTALIAERSGDNPNVLPIQQFNLLVNSIRSLGFIQAVTVRKMGAGWEMIDGHHRLRAALEIGLKEIPAVVVTADDLTSSAEVLSLNKIRGEIDLGIAATILKTLEDNDFADLTVTGFNGGEIQTLLASLNSSSDITIPESAEGDDDPERVIGVQRHSIKMVFDKVDDRDFVRTALLKYGATIEAGVLELLHSKVSR